RAVFHSAVAVGQARSHQPDYEGYVDTVIYGCWKKDVFDRVGYFDEELVRNQDDEFNLRLTRAGGKIYQSPRIRSWYHVRGSLKTLFRQYMQYGYWKALVIRKHHAPASLRHLVPGTFVGCLCLLTALGLFWHVALGAALGMAALYSVAALLASVAIAGSTEWVLIPVLPVVIWCFHFGYGFGFILGVLDFLLFLNVLD